MKIDKNIPVPTTRNKREIPYEKMKIGDSVLIENITTNNTHHYRLRGIHKVPGSAWTFRKTENGIRMWRIA